MCIRDSYDRAFGDEVIRFVAQRIQSSLPEDARVYRLDGDEFAVIVDDDVDVLRSAYAQLGGMFQRQHDHEGRKFYCTLSGGIAQYHGDAETYESLVKYANYALEHAKGLSLIHIFTIPILTCMRAHAPLCLCACPIFAAPIVRRLSCLRAICAQNSRKRPFRSFRSALEPKKAALPKPTVPLAGGCDPDASPCLPMRSPAPIRC